MDHRSRSRAVLASGFVWFFLLSGCAGNDDQPASDTAAGDADTDADSDADADADTDADTDTTTADTASTAPTWADVSPIFTTRCKGCHYLPVGPPSGDFLFMDSTDLVGVPSNELPTMAYIKAHEPDASYVWLKLNGMQAGAGGSGVPMPKTGGPLSATELQQIHDWIVGGALP